MACNDKDKQVTKNTNFLMSLRHALDGLVDIYREERNFRKHLVVAILVVIAGLVVHLYTWEWLWMIVAIFAVIILEMVNTIIENVVDLIVDYKYHPLAKKIKDIAAGAVLVTAIFAVIIGLFVFLPHIIYIIRRTI